MDLESEELKKNGHVLKLRSQPFRMLAIIAERNGDVITREELRAQLWPAMPSGDYKHSANNPEYVETVSRGYRFLKPVEFIIGSSANGNGSKASLTASLLIEIRQEFINTAGYRGLTLLFCRCKRLCNQCPSDPNLPDLQLLMADIQLAIDRSAALEPGGANPTISNEVASFVFDDPNAVSVPDHFGGWKTIGLASESVLLVVEHSVHRENGKQVVLIHRARRATPQERRFYEQTRK
jgi:DNA-binding winged helix-turn-helix (wHTH) protein/uncharacterized DUF497 family protein